ncbi:hypothetical protein [Methyloferula stellata]|uniref:hypothetical protein n=1 Tax=Methyloferula stellata TaxID=876270 RepID=UPI0003827333|nr:hypothetical protein [Methyloferula stellata]
MGFDLFIHSYKGDEPALYDRRLLEDIFNRDAIDPTSPLSEVRYADGRGEVYGADDDQINGIMLSHFGGRTIVERAFELADKTKALICWPGEEVFMAVTNREVLDHLPTEVDQETVAVVAHVDELIAVIGLI